MGTPFKRRYFATVGSYSVKTVTDRYRHVANRNKPMVMRVKNGHRPPLRKCTVTVVCIE